MGAGVKRFDPMVSTAVVHTCTDARLTHGMTLYSYQAED